MTETSLATKEVSSREVMEQIVARALLEGIQSFRNANPNDNMLLRELKGIHSNTTMEDLPPHIQKLIRETAQSLFGYLAKERFVLVPHKTKR